MKTIFKFPRFHLFLTRYEWAYLEFWAKWDYHNIIISCTILTFEVGFVYVWRKTRDDLKKKTIQWCWIKG